MSEAEQQIIEALFLHLGTSTDELDEGLQEYTLILESLTMIPDYHASLDGEVSRLQGGNYVLSQSLIREYVTANETAAVVPAPSGSPLKIQLVDSTVIDSLIHNNSSHGFSLASGENAALVTISRPGIAADQALIFCSVGRGPMAAISAVYLLERSPSGWTVLEMIPVAFT